MPNRFFVVSPILHPCKLIKASPIVLGEKVTVRTITNEHLGAVLKKIPSYASFLKPNSKCIIVDCNDTHPNKNSVTKDLLSSTFSLNAFSESGSIIHHAPITIRHNRVHTAIDVYDHQSTPTTDDHRYEIRSGTKPSEISTVYSSVRRAIDRDPKFLISLRRFNAAMSKSFPDEKIIDMAICLESMFSSQSEIAFQFSVYNAILSEKDTDRRLDAYILLKKFYGWRSKIVHGTHILDQGWFDNHWDTIVRLATLSILSKTEFISENEPSDWQQHLEKLALGMEVQA